MGKGPGNMAQTWTSRLGGAKVTGQPRWIRVAVIGDMVHSVGAKNEGQYLPYNKDIFTRASNHKSWSWFKHQCHLLGMPDFCPLCDKFPCEDSSLYPPDNEDVFTLANNHNLMSRLNIGASFLTTYKVRVAGWNSAAVKFVSYLAILEFIPGNEDVPTPVSNYKFNASFIGICNVCQLYISCECVWKSFAFV